MLPKLPKLNPINKNYIIGTDQNDNIYGTSGVDLIYAGKGNDVLHAGAGADSLYGGEGDDSYYIRDSDDFAYENAGEGHDHVYSSVTYTLGDNLEALNLIGNQAINGTGNSLNNYLCGNDNNNILIGLGGNDQINGGMGADIMFGGSGDDRYFVDNVGDKVLEFALDGHDTVTSSISFSLIGTNVEDLILESGAGAINGTGNDSDNSILGNQSANILKGGDGDDQISGFGGKDTMYGGKGDDYIVVDSTDDIVIENITEGYDTVFTTANYTMPENVEFMIMDGAGPMLGFGNGQDNAIMGSLFADHIYGLGGDDTIVGRSGNDVITGGAGNDTMFGGADNDTFRFLAGFGHDTILDFGANGNDDMIHIDHNLFADFNAIQAHMTQNGNDVVITLDADNSITLENFNAGILTASDFHFV